MQEHSEQDSPSVSRQVGKWYTDAQKLNALKLWLITGNLREVSASMNIKYDTLKTWKASKWWVEMSEDIRTEGHIALSHKMQQVANKAIEVTMERLENGDHVVDQRTGSLIRKPVNMRDAHQAAISFQDRALKLETGRQTEHNPAVVDRLQSIADAFAKMIKPPKNTEVIDVSFTDVQDVRESPDSGELVSEVAHEESEILSSEDLQGLQIQEVSGVGGEQQRESSGASEAVENPDIS